MTAEQIQEKAKYIFNKHGNMVFAAITEALNVGKEERDRLKEENKRLMEENDALNERTIELDERIWEIRNKQKRKL